MKFSNPLSLNKIAQKRGYTLLFAVVISSLVLGIAAFILSVSRKQFVLASAARESSAAVYAADSGIECEVEAYNVVKQTFPVQSGSTQINCAGNSITFTFSTVTLSSADAQSMKIDTSHPVYQTPQIVLALPGNGCALMTITDGIGSDLGGYHKTVIDSRGYNIGTALSCPTAIPRTLERALRLVYED